MTSLKGNRLVCIFWKLGVRMLAENKERAKEGIEQSREEVVQLESKYEKEIKWVFLKGIIN